MASVISAHISYTLVEARFRVKESFDKAIIAVYKLAAIFIVAAISCRIIDYSSGLKYRASEAVISADNRYYWDKAQTKHNGCSYVFKKFKGIADCKLGNEQAEPSVAIWGDSHANALSKAIVDAYESHKRSAYLYSYPACPPVIGAHFDSKNGKKCEALNYEMQKNLSDKTNIKDVFLISRWPMYIYGFNEAKQSNNIYFDDAIVEDNNQNRINKYNNEISKTACDIVKSGKRVYLVKTTPEIMNDVPKLLAKRLFLNNKNIEISITREEYESRNAFMDSAYKDAKKCGVKIIDLTKKLCDEKKCYAYKDGHGLYSDDDHLNIYGDDVVKPLFVEAISGK